jgi:peptidyl-prolyl cis-trans isomerase D
MAIIGKIREKSSWVIGLIGLAMLGFIATDLLSNKLFHDPNSQKGLGKIFGEEISQQEFGDKYQAALRATEQQKKGEPISLAEQNQINDQTWQDFIDDKIMDREAKALGLDVPGVEIYDMIIGPYPDATATQYLGDQKTHIINKAMYKPALDNPDAAIKPEQREGWDRFLDYLAGQRLKNKYRTLVKAGQYATDLEMADEIEARDKRSAVQFVPLFLSTIPDSTVAITDDEIKDYYNKHKEDYKREDSRTFEYVTFDVRPSKDDSDNTKKSVEALMESFKKTDDDSAFVVTHGKGAYSNKFEPRGTLKEETYLGKREDSIFRNVKDGALIGPFYENGSWKLAKIVDHKDDTVYYMRASHILIEPMTKMPDKKALNPQEYVTQLVKYKADSVEAYNKAKRIYDSVRKPGVDFAKAAQEKSEDGSASKGGDLGWFKEGQMVKQFNDAVKGHNKGDIVLVSSQFGTHVIKVTDEKTKRVLKIAVLEKPVSVGQETKTKAYNLATLFRNKSNDAKSFDATVKAMNLNKRVASLIKPNQHDVPGIENSRDLIRWSFKEERKEGDISDAAQMGDKFVVAKLTNIYKDGYASLDEIKKDVKVLAQHEKKKQILADKLKAAKDKYKTLEEIAKEVKSNVSSADGITFQNPNIQNLANEPDVAGAVEGMKLNEISEPIKGQNGVFIVKVTNVVEAKFPPTYDKDRKMRIDQLKQGAEGESKQALHKQADVKDYRYNFY